MYYEVPLSARFHCRLLPKTKAAIWIQARARGWLKRVALWQAAAAQGKQMRKTLLKALPEEQAAVLWKRWGRAGLTFDGLLSLRPNQLGVRRAAPNRRTDATAGQTGACVCDRFTIIGSASRWTACGRRPHTHAHAHGRRGG